MNIELAGVGNALMDALVVVDNDAVLGDLHLARGTTHMVDHETWEQAYSAVRELKVTFDSGGSCANTVATVGLLGGEAIFCGQVGDDQMGELALAALQDDVGTGGITKAPNSTTAITVLMQAKTHQVKLTCEGANDEIDGRAPHMSR